MKIAVRDLMSAIYCLEDTSRCGGRSEDRDALRRVAEYLRFVADQRQEYEATRGPADPRMDFLKSALKKVQSARAARVSAARRGG